MDALKGYRGSMANVLPLQQRAGEELVCRRRLKRLFRVRSLA